MAWLSGWTYRKEITLSRASDAVTLYQMKLLVGESADATGEDVDCNSHVLPTLNDLRFTSSDGQTLLDYWIESITGTTPTQLATVWIEFDSIGTGATTFYMYYGKADAAVYSNGVNTFLYFDDFSGDTVGVIPAGWSELENPTRGTCLTIANGYSGQGVEFVCSQITYRAGVTISPGTQFCVEARVKFVGNGEFDIFKSATYRGGIRRAGTPTYFQDLDSLAWDNTALAEDGNWHKVKMFVYDTNKIDFLIDATSIANQAIYGAAQTADEICVRFQETGTVDVDEIFVRNYRATEPAWGSWGVESFNATVDVGLQSGSKSLFSVSENTDQILSQNLISKAGSLFSPSFVLDQILAQNLQSGNKTIFQASNVTDQILSQNLLTSITSVLSVLVSIDQSVSVNVIPVAGSLYEVTVDTGEVTIIVNVGLLLAVGSALETLLQTDQVLSQGIIEKLGSVFAPSQNTDQILQQNMIAALGAILSSSQSVDQTVQLNALSALASIYQILVQILAAPEKFGYLNLKLELPPALPEGSFAYEHSSLKVIDEGLEGSFNFEHLKTTVEQNLLGWFVAPWFSDWFGEEVFVFEHQRLMESAPVEGANFKFENLKSITPSVILNDDFKYKRV